MKLFVNCLTHALTKWREEGGYIVFRKSEHWGVPHVLHVSTEGEFSSYVPKGRLPHPLLAIFGFEGEEIDQDNEYNAKPMKTTSIVAGSVLLLGGAVIWATGRAWARGSAWVKQKARKK